MGVWSAFVELCQAGLFGLTVAGITTSINGSARSNMGHGSRGVLDKRLDLDLDESDSSA